MAPPHSQWSEWIWSDEFHSYYRYKPDERAPGRYVYDYQRAETEAVPRTNAGAVDALAEGVSRLRYSTDDGTRLEAQGQYQYSNGPSSGSSSKPWSKPAPQSQSQAKSSSSQSKTNRDRFSGRDRDRDRGKDKDRDRDREHGRDRGRDKDRDRDRDRDQDKAKDRDRDRSDRKTTSASLTSKFNDKGDRVDKGDKTVHKGKTVESPSDKKTLKGADIGAYPDGQKQKLGYTVQRHHQTESERCRNDTVPSTYYAESLQYAQQYAQHQTGGEQPSYPVSPSELGTELLGPASQQQGFVGTVSDQPRFPAPSISPHITRSTTQPTVDSPSIHRSYGDDGLQGVRSTDAVASYRAATDATWRIGSTEEGYRDELDSRYKLESSHQFSAGMVFKALWPEPMGSSSAAPPISDRKRVPDGYGGDVHVGFRRFIVIANDAGHCTCVPILTYNGQACKKKGAKPEKHGIVFEKGKRARLLEGEPALGFEPISVNIVAEGESLSRESRVNYSKLITVEHNVKVFFIGHVVESDFGIAQAAVDTCWINKNRDIKQSAKR